MKTEKRLIDANAIPWEEYYVPDPDSNVQWDYKKELSVIKPVVDQMPTVDAVEVVHGRWIERKEIFSENEGEVDAIGCSECGKSQRKYLRTNYCPNCGAKMDGGRTND